MPPRRILLLGDPALYERCAPVERHEIDDLLPVVRDMHDTLLDFRARRGVGRAIAAPQIGVMKRLVYMHVGESRSSSTRSSTSSASRPSSSGTTA